MAGMELSELRTRARDAIGEPEADRYSDAQIDRELNLGQEDFCARTGYIESSWAISITNGTATYSVPADLLEITRATLDDLKIQETTFGELDKLDEDIDETDDTDRENMWINETGIPTNYLWETEKVIRLYPEPDADADGKTLKLYGYQRPDTLTNDTDKTIIPYEYAVALIDYAAWKIFQMDGDNTRATMHRGAYLEMVEVARKRKLRRIKEPVLEMEANTDFRFYREEDKR